MPKKKIEVYNKDELIYPFIESDHVSFSNGMKVSEMLNQSISMPTVAHEDLSFKVGVGDQDVSSAIVNSSVAKMTIKGKTYQNILPEPSTHVLTNNKEMFKVNEGLDPNVEIVDGVSKSAILSGRTLVNLVTYDKTNLSTSIWNHFVHFSDLKYNLKSSTKYLLIFNITNCNVNSTFTIQLDDKSQYTYFKGKGIYINGNGVYKTIRETKDDLSNISSVLFTAHNPETTSGTYDMKIMIIEYQEGMENWDIPYFEGMQSVKMPVLTTIGKNTFNSKNAGANRIGWYSIPLELSFSGEVYVKVADSLPSDFRVNIFSNNIEYPLTNSMIKNGYNNSFQNITSIDFHCPSLSIEENSRGNLDDLFENGNIVIELGGESYKSNILSCNEEVALRGIGDVQDTLNCNTGEYVQRFGEIVLDGTQGFSQDVTSGDFKRFTLHSSFVSNMKVRGAIMCDKFVQIPDANATQEGITTGGNENYRLMLWVESSRLSTPDVAGLQAWLQQNPVTVQYELTTPIVKTVDLSSSGNWEKIVLDGSENWLMTNNTHFYTMLSNELSPNALLPIIDNSLFTPKDNADSTANAVWYGGNIGAKNGNIVFNILDKTLEQFKQYLSQNPITVWYQTTNHKDSTQVKQPIFFKDGHIQLSSGADNSLIPTLDYQAKTSNSYVMDLMKANTRYTMKAKSANGTFTIDGTSYGAGTNSTFTTPSSITNKLLVMSNKANEEVMILEGDVTSKTIPYFKGIKSAFEGEDKIEVLSTSQNILDTSKIVQGDLLTNGIIGETGGSADLYCYTEEFIPCPNIKHPLYVHRTIDGVYSQSSCYIFFFNEDKKLLQPRTVSNTFIIPDGAEYLRIMVYKGDVDVSRVGIMVTNNESDRFNQSVGGLQNSTKIPLLSPLKSLPNGVKDELIIDRANNKVALIQRIGEVVFDGSESLSSWIYNDNGIYKSIRTSVNNCVKVTTAIRDSVLVRCDKYIPIHYNAPWTTNKMVSVDVSGNIVFCGDEIRDTKTWINILKSNPTIVYYQLATPVITEVDLEGFPYVYKDGHIFLNSEIAPTTEITYSINQCQQISASNEDIIRHEKELTYLQKLIAQYVQVDYESVLLSLKV